jgi:prepilin-type N-terminal cleavage/methylation domain-containing protein
MLRKAFTLIELLVVIGIMAVLAAGVITLINPVEKTRQANDAQIQNSIGEFATSLQSYAAQNNGTYPTTAQGLAYLVTVGELQTQPSPPTGYSAWTYTNTAGNVFTCGQLRSKKYTSAAAPGPYTFWMWCNNGRNAGPAAACAWASCP